MYSIGLDLGQRRDHSAIAVVERRDGKLGLRWAERVPLGTPYPQVVTRVGGIIERIGREQMSRGYGLWGGCQLTVDATGVGAPVVDLLKQAQLGCDLWAVTMTGGERAHAAGSMGSVTRWNVPKRDLMAGVQVLLERGDLRIARRLPEVGALLRELADVRLTAQGGGRARMGADGSGEHDDLVIALALACWRAKQGQIGFGGGRLPGI